MERTIDTVFRIDTAQCIIFIINRFMNIGNQECTLVSVNPVLHITWLFSYNIVPRYKEIFFPGMDFVLTFPLDNPDLGLQNDKIFGEM